MGSHVKPYGVLFVLLDAANKHFFEQIRHVASTAKGKERVIGKAVIFRTDIPSSHYRCSTSEDIVTQKCKT